MVIPLGGMGPMQEDELEYKSFGWLHGPLFGHLHFCAGPGPGPRARAIFGARGPGPGPGKPQNQETPKIDWHIYW